MNGLGGLNKSPNGVVLGMVQLQLPTVVTTEDLAAQTNRIVEMVGKARRNLGTMDLVVFPEYALHGLSMDTNPDIMCSMDGPEVAAFKQACVDNHIWGCFSIMEYNPDGYPWNTGLIWCAKLEKTGVSKTTFTSLVTVALRRLKAAHRIVLTLTCRTWWQAVTNCHGKPKYRSRMAHPVASQNQHDFSAKVQKQRQQNNGDDQVRTLCMAL